MAPSTAHSKRSHNFILKCQHLGHQGIQLPHPHQALRCSILDRTARTERVRIQASNSLTGLRGCEDGVAQDQGGAQQSQEQQQQLPEAAPVEPDPHGRADPGLLMQRVLAVGVAGQLQVRGVRGLGVAGGDVGVARDQAAGKNTSQQSAT